MRCSRTEAPSLHRRYPASPYYGPLRHPARPDLTLAGCRLARATPPGLPVLRPFPSSTRAVANTPAETAGLPSLASRPLAAFPVWQAGHSRIAGFEAFSAFARATARVVAEPPKAALCRRSASADVDLHRPLRLLPAGATVAGRDSHPLRNGAFHGAPPRAARRTSGGWH